MEKQEIERKFSWSNKAWYAEANKIDRPEICINLYGFNGDLQGEFLILWEEFNGALIPKLEVYDDAWKALATAKELIDELALYDNKNISDTEMVKILLGLGFKDETEYERSES